QLPWCARLLGVPLLLPVLLWQAPRPPAGEFEVLAADVGQGNAVLVRTATHTLVYDTGPGYSRETDAGQRVLVPLLRAFGETVHTVVLSHRDLDHTGGAGAVLRMQPGAALLSSLEDGHALRALRPGPRCTAGLQWDWDGVRFSILHPAAADYDSPGRPNTVSCVLRISTSRATALLAGDIEKAQEATLVARGDGELRADLLLVPHHGSKTSSSAPFLAAVQPAIAIVQAGYRNRFGHPAGDVVERYRAAGVRLEASFRCGAASWRSQSPAAVTCERARSPRYWQHRAEAPTQQGE
ncbi:MAG: MBL fold metallo-hydrolase, partial [Comamonadaceae bacterium]